MRGRSRTQNVEMKGKLLIAEGLSGEMSAVRKEGKEWVTQNSRYIKKYYGNSLVCM